MYCAKRKKLIRRIIGKKYDNYFFSGKHSAKKQGNGLIETGSKQ